MPVLEMLAEVLAANGLITAFAFVGLVVWLSYLFSNRLTGENRTLLAVENRTPGG